MLSSNQNKGEDFRDNTFIFLALMLLPFERLDARDTNVLELQMVCRNPSLIKRQLRLVLRSVMFATTLLAV